MSKKQFLVVAENLNQLMRVYNFIAESVSPIATKYDDHMIETPGYDVIFMLEEQNTLGMRVQNYIYLGSDYTYEALYLHPCLIK